MLAAGSLLAVIRPEHWLLAAICAFVAASPDLLWINKYTQSPLWQPRLATNLFPFANRIQWFQRPIGAVVEVAWFVAGIALLLPFLR